MTETTTTQETPAVAPSSDGDEVIVARSGRYYRNTRYLFVLGMIAMGAWFARDGWVRYPQERALHQQNPKTGVPHTETDIHLQKVLGCALPVLGVAFLGWTLYRSRGTYRLQGNVLSVPGHPDVPLDSVVAIDKSKWDRKGIAHVDYELLPPSGPRGGNEPVLDYRAPVGRLTLDDFIYERPPTDRIVERIEKHLSQSAPPAAVDEPSA